MADKAVILARGLGTRMRKECDGVRLGEQPQRLAAEGLKVLMPLAGRPLLSHLVAALARAGMGRICCVVAPDADLLRGELGRIAAEADVTIECAVQQEALGTADAVLAAEAFVAGENFLLLNGDNLYPQAALHRLAGRPDGACWVAAFAADALVAQGNVRPDRVKDFAVVQASAEGRLLGIIEKPADPDQYAQDGRLWVNMNLYRFTADIFDACRRVRPSPERGELELTAAVADLVAARTVDFHVLQCYEAVLDLTTRADIPAAERLLVRRNGENG